MSTDSFARTSDEAETPGKTFEIKRERTEVWSKSRNSIYLMVLAIFEAIIVIALESVIYAKFTHTQFSERNLGIPIPVYLIIFIFSQVFQVALAWDAIRAQNTIQVIAFVLFNLCCFVYAAFQFRQIADAISADSSDDHLHAITLKGLIYQLLIVCAVITGVCELIYLYIGARLYQEFGWRIYKKIGADPEIRNMYRWYQIFLTILKLDIFFLLGYSIQYLVLVLTPGDVEYPLTIIALPITCLVLVLAVYAVRHESRPLIILFFLGLAAGVAYFVFKIYRIYDQDQKYKYKNVGDFLTFFASVTLLLLVLTIINASICWSSFNKGLKSHLLRDKPTDPLTRNPVERTLSLD
ncbi:hypothetical protein BDF14DRAFT_1976411 [Spinellus fusiger]|nr:hypothetical protein BDF14DRAFT_1976411 [Spinellus fusiger]